MCQPAEYILKWKLKLSIIMLIFGTTLKTLLGVLGAGFLRGLAIFLGF